LGSSSSSTSRLESPALNLVFYVKGFPPRETGGPVEVAYRIVRELVNETSYRITLIVQTASTIEEIRSRLGSTDRLRVLPLGYYLGPQDATVFSQILAAFRDADIVHFNEFPFRHMPYLLLARIHQIPLVFSLHGRLSTESRVFLGDKYPLRLRTHRGLVDFRIPGIFVGLLVHASRWFGRGWSAVVVNSEANRRNAVEGEGLDPARVYTIPNGVDLPIPPPNPPNRHSGLPRLLYVGKLEEVKGPDLLLAALECLTLDGRSVDLTLAGSGSLEPKLRAKAGKLIGHRATFL